MGYISSYNPLMFLEFWQIPKVMNEIIIECSTASSNVNKMNDFFLEPLNLVIYNAGN